MRSYEAVLFDLFGTLVPNFSSEGDRLALTAMSDALGLATDVFATRWYDTFHHRATGAFPTIEANLEFLCHELGANPGSDALKLAVTRRNHFYSDALAPLPGTMEALAALKHAGLKIALVSDCSAEVIEWWEASDLAKAFDSAVFSCALGVRKPDPAIYLEACERLAVKPQACLYVGDGGSNELSGARRLGMTTFLIREARFDAAVVYSSEAGAWDGPVLTSISELHDKVR